jgi:HK97 family phage prohead protease
MKNLTLLCEARLLVQESANEAAEPSGKIEARVTTWGAREGADGRKFNYQPEGFADWALEFASAGKPLPMFLNHNDMGMPVGEWNSFEFDDDGMTAQGRLYLNTVGGSDIYTIMKESPNMFGGVSVGAYAEEASWVDAEGNEIDDNTPIAQARDSYFQITKGGLREVSVVMYPNNDRAEVTKLECFDAAGHPNPRQIEKVLRDAGLSKKDATTASSILKKLIESRDVTPPVIEEPPKPSESDAVDEASILAALEQRELLKKLNAFIKE